MKKNRASLLLIFFGVLLLVAACTPQAVPGVTPTVHPTELPSIVTATSTVTAQPIEPRYVEGLFTSVNQCVVCHNNLKDEAGNDVSNVRQWETSMMALAAIDPYYLASVSAEIARHPEARAVIEDKCAACHMPMARFATTAVEGTPVILGEMGYLDSNHPLHTDAIEGVSCTVCHQILPDNFGSAESFSGEMLFDFTTPAGERNLFGPYPADPGASSLMRAVSGFGIEQSDHLAQSEMCATCHMLYTPFFLSDGSLSPTTFPEQTPYLEWKASSFSATHSCQDCHMPLAEGAVVLSTTGGEPRSPFNQHTFTGGNVYMLQLIQAFREELGVKLSAESFDTAIQETEEFLQTKTATIQVSNAQASDGKLNFDVTVNSFAGHKFPTSFPSRRAWLQVTVSDADGVVVFNSGTVVDDSGFIQGNDNDENPLKFEPHYEVITSEDQVQIYESIMGNDLGEVTTGLLLAAQYLKDNRLLPDGFDKQKAHADYAVYGDALQDADFIGGEDVVRYSIALGETSQAYTITVRLLYQSIGFRWAINLTDTNTPEVERFMRYYNATPNTAVVIAEQTLKVE